MAIQKMKKLELFVLENEKDELLRGLQSLGIMELAEQSSEDSGIAELVPAVSEGLSAARNAQSKLEAAIAVVRKHYKDKRGFLTPNPDVSEKSFFDKAATDSDLARAEYILGLDGGIKKAEADIARENGLSEQLEPWLTLDLPLNFEGTARTAYQLMSMPVKKSLAEVQRALGEQIPEAELKLVSSDEMLSYLELIVLREREDEAILWLRGEGVSLMTRLNIPRSAREEKALLERRVKKLKEEIALNQDKIAAEGKYLDDLRLSSDVVASEIARCEAEQKLLKTAKTSVLSGWVAEEDEEKLKDYLSGFHVSYESREPLEEEYPEVPIKLKNNVITRALNVITDMYSYPAYNGVDANPLMTPFFILFYGMMMADMGYGLLLTIMCGLVLIKKRPKGGARSLFELMFYGGISTFIFGALTGGFFGDAPLQLAKVINPETTWQGLPALFTPIDDTIAIMGGAMALGFIHLMTGTVVSFSLKIKRGQWVSAICSEGAWWVIFAGGALAVLKIGNVGNIPVVLCIGILMLFFGAQAGAEGIGGKIVAVLNTIYSDVTGYFGDILSYSRLMALMLAGSVVASVFNIIGGITGSVVGFLVVSIIGNALNFALNVLGCFVHDLRLQCLEFFGKFYEDGGKPFRPLAFDQKYVNIIREK